MYFGSSHERDKEQVPSHIHKQKRKNIIKNNNTNENNYVTTGQNIWLCVILKN